MELRVITMEKAKELVEYYDKTESATVQKAAKKFGISRSTAHKILTEIPTQETIAKLKKNKEEGRRRGLEAFKKNLREKS